MISYKQTLKYVRENDPSRLRKSEESDIKRTCCCFKQKLPTFTDIRDKIEEIKKEIQEEKCKMDQGQGDQHGSFSGKAFITFK